MIEAKTKLGLSRILFADFGKNMLGYHRAAQAAGLRVLGIADDALAQAGREYRGLPILPLNMALSAPFDAIVVSNLSPVHAQRRVEVLTARTDKPILDLLNPTWPMEPRPMGDFVRSAATSY